MLKRHFTRLYWRIGEIAELTGITQQTLRTWEQEFGMLRPRRDASGVRVYRERDFRIVLVLQQLIEKEQRPISDVRSIFTREADRVREMIEAVPPEALGGAADDATQTRRPERPARPPRPTPALPTVDQPRELAAPYPENPVLPPTVTADAERPGQLPDWVVQELVVLRRELVAIGQMLDALGASQSSGEAAGDGEVVPDSEDSAIEGTGEGTETLRDGGEPLDNSECADATDLPKDASAPEPIGAIPPPDTKPPMEGIGSAQELSE